MTLTLDAAAVERLLQGIDTLSVMRQLFKTLGEGEAVQPPQTLTLFPHNRGDFISYLGALGQEGVFGTKLSPYVVTPSGPLITAWTCLMSMSTGQPLLLCDAAQLTTERTAGTTALAVELLSRPDASKLAIIGSGKIAQAHLRLVAKLRNWNEVRVYSPTIHDNAERRQTFEDIYPGVELSKTSGDAVKDADVVMLCTSSGTPVIDTNAIAQHALVTSISTNVARAHEVEPAFLNRAQVYCDYRATAPLSAGEMVIAARDHSWAPTSIIGDLAEILVGRAPLPTPARPTFFRSIGQGIEDIAMANAIYVAAAAAR